VTKLPPGTRGIHANPRLILLVSLERRRNRLGLLRSSVRCPRHPCSCLDHSQIAMRLHHEQLGALCNLSERPNSMHVL
jgi:hypothetical protein